MMSVNVLALPCSVDLVRVHTVSLFQWRRLASRNIKCRMVLEKIQSAIFADPATWTSAIISNGSIFAVGLPVLRTGLTWVGVCNAFLLGIVLWRAYGRQGLLIAALYFVMGTAATKVKIKQKEAEGIAEGRKGKRGAASVWGSGSAAALCALATTVGYGGSGFASLWKLAFVASFCTKLSDTVSSEIGKAYGKTTYLVTTLSKVPRGTEGAISLEGTLAGLTASILLAGAGFELGQVSLTGMLICVIASQLANIFESYIGATLQGRGNFQWLNNDVVNVLNITAGAGLAITLGYLLKE